MKKGLEGKVALVTGGGIRLGRALCLGLAEAGAQVAVHFHSSQKEAAEVVGTLKAQGVKAQAFAADLRDLSAPEALVQAVEKALGRVDILVNSAAGFERAAFLDSTPELLEQQWSLNARAPFLLSQAVARRMVAYGAGDIVNILDVGGALLPWRGYAAYGMSKAALAHLTRCLALELAPAVRVNGVAPGTVLPPAQLPASWQEAQAAKVPQKKLGSPEDVVAAVRFFLEGPRYITGQILAVDGGRTLESGGSWGA